MWSQLAIADVLEPKDPPEGYQPSIHRRKITGPIQVQLLSFAVGVTFIVANGTVMISCASQDSLTEVAADVPDPWGLPAPPPKGVYNGPLFELSHDYPAHATPPDPAPWRAAIGNGRITTGNADAYVQALKDNIAADMRVLLFDYANWNAGARGWYNQPWLSSTPLSNGTYTREPIHGTYVGSAGVPAGMFPKSGLKTSMDTHVLVYYDAVAAASLSRVWGTSGNDPVPGLQAGGAQFPEGAIIVKPAFTTAGGNDWPPIAGAFPWTIWVAEGEGTTGPPSLTTVYLFQLDIIVKDTKSAPKTGWVFSTLVYSASTPGDKWDKMIPLGAMWGNDPNVISPEGCDPLVPGSCPPLSETWINQLTPVYARETLGWGGRLSGPNDGAVDINARIKTGTGTKPYPGRYAMSSCLGCHGSAEYQMNSFLLPVPADCSDESCKPTVVDGSLVYYPSGSAEFMRWFQNRSGADPMDPGTIALDYEMNYSFKTLPAWFEATGQKGPLHFVEGFDDYRGHSHPK
ncbi:MAG: hypothetical protein V3T53_02270 [Phycisphaerales bacterium]